MTGVHRAEVGSVISENKLENTNQNIVNKIIGYWTSNKDYIDENGKQSEFSELVLAVNSSLNPYTVLNEMLRVKALIRNETKVNLKVNSYIPDKDNEENIFYLANDLLDLTRAVVSNIENE